MNYELWIIDSGYWMPPLGFARDDASGVLASVPHGHTAGPQVVLGLLD